MALWLFRRKSRRKRSHGVAAPSDEGPRSTQKSFTAPNGAPPVPDRHQSTRKQRNETKKLHRRARTYSFEEGQHDSINVDRLGARGKRGSAPALRGMKGDPIYSSNHHASRDGSFSVMDDLERVPTLHATKRDGQHLMPRKSSKRRKNAHDREREAELKAWSNFVPARPATDAWTAGRPMRKDTRRVRTGLGLGLTPRSDDPSSEVSLPTPESIHSSLSSDSEQVSYKVSAFDVLAPKPTLRYAITPRYVPPNGLAPPQRTPSQRRRMTDRDVMPEATLRAHQRIDELADDLNASDLRELMERDQRRRERKQQKEQEKIERRLARRADRERQAVENGGQVPPNLERGVLGRESVGLGIETTSAVVTSSKRRSQSPESKEGQIEEAQAGDEISTDGQHPTPLDSFHRTDSVLLETSAPQDIRPPSPPPASARMSFLRTQQSISKSSFSEQEKMEVSEAPRKGSESSAARNAISWSSIFKWGTKSKRHSGPSSFSNTSRDSMATQPAAATPGAPNTQPRVVGSGVPKRTGSRFREDLPDFLMSPPDSRVQSPEAEPVPPAIMEQDSPRANDTTKFSAMATVEREAEVTSDREEIGRVPISEVDPSPEPQSMSLASIDSEASWLSGKVASRRHSPQTARQRDSLTRSLRSGARTRSSTGASAKTIGSPEQGSPEEDAAGIVDDEYLERFVQHSGPRAQVGEARPSSDEEDDARWGAVGGQVPTVVHSHKANRIKSREGLLHTFGEEGESDSAGLESPISPGSDFKVEEAGVQRATSVHLGKGHARHISAGSAKLLDLTPRSSVDVKRRSWEPRQRAQ